MLEFGKKPLEEPDGYVRKMCVECKKMDFERHSLDICGKWSETKNVGNTKDSIVTILKTN